MSESGLEKEIIVDINPYQTRVVLLEQGTPSEIYIERRGRERLVGNIYKGRVQNVLPGMQAAFVDIGLEKNAYLCGTRPSSNTNIEESRCAAIGLSLFLFYHIGQIKQLETMFDDGTNASSNIVSFFAGFLHNFRKCLYKENLTIP